MKRIFAVFKRMNIKAKITAAFSLISIVSLIIIVSISYIRDSEIIKGNIQETAARDANILKMDIERYLGLDSDTYIQGISHSFIIDVFSKDAQSYSSFEKVQLVKQLYNFVNEMESNRIPRVKIYIDDDMLLFADERNFFPLSTIENEPWYEDLINSSNTIQWSLPHYPDYTDYYATQMVITANYLLKNPKNFVKPICVMSVDVSEKGLRELLENRIISDKHYVTVLNDASQVISTTNKNNGFTAEFFSDIASKSTWYIKEHENEKYMTLSLPINKTPWRLLYIVNLDTALEPIVQTRNFIIVLSGIMIAVLIIVSIILSRGITGRITNLHDAVMSISEGELKNITIKTDNYDDEISDLQTSFSKMVTRLDSLLDERYQMAINLKSAEMRALQAQINPHFLYNTLDIISWRAVRQKNHDIYNLIKNLAKYYKLSLNHGKEIVTLADELAHITHYIYIQNERFNNIALDINVDESLHNILIPKLTLQPIVENSVIHGLLEKEPPGGKITISARTSEDGFAVLDIIDDGVGISPERLEELFKEQQSIEFGSNFGLNNVRYRLRLSVGGDLKISSRLGEGVKLTIVLPLEH